MAIEGGYYNFKITKIKSSKNTSKNEQNTWQKYTKQNHTKNDNTRRIQWELNYKKKVKRPEENS